jgi:NAD(P)H-hydrate epimerase
MRAGAGLVTALVPRSLNPILETKLTEPMTRPVDETPEGSIALSAEKQIREWMEKCNVLVIGPGMSRVPETADLVRRIVSGARIPVVLDADGLNAFEGRADELRRPGATVVITPHPGEMSRLMGVGADELEMDRITTAISAAARFGCIVVSKGASTVIAGPDGRAYLNPTGNSGMASGGTGDVLSGVIAGLLGQGCPIFEGAALGAYLHGRAGDIAVQQLGVWGLLAGDMIEVLPDAMMEVWKEKETEEDVDDEEDEEDS